MSDKIAEILNISANLPAVPDGREVFDLGEKQNTKDDVNAVRDNLYHVLEIGNGALAELAQVAAQSQHPKAYEALTLMINSLVNANKELVDTAKKRQILLADQNQEGPQTVHNTLVIGTSELIDKLRNG